MTVEPYEDGKPVRARDVSGSTGADTVFFRRLAAGAYEVERDRPVVTGGGASLAEMAGEIARRKAEVERLKGK